MISPCRHGPAQLSRFGKCGEVQSATFQMTLEHPVFAASFVLRPRGACQPAGRARNLQQMFRELYSMIWNNMRVDEKSGELEMDFEFWSKRQSQNQRPFGQTNFQQFRQKCVFGFREICAILSELPIKVPLVSIRRCPA
jgi:hypothetical protein